MAFYSKRLSRLTPDQYLPRAGNPSDPTYRWSISLNLAIWIKVETLNTQTLSLYIEYDDSRDRQSILIDNLLQDKDKEILFSNLVKVPIYGPIKNVELKLMHQDPYFEFQVDEVFVRVIDAPPDPEMSKTA